MTEENQETKTGIVDLNSKFWRTFLVIFAALLIFAGPTYLVVILIHDIGVNYFASMVAGFAVFVVGLLLMGYLIRKKIIT